MLTPIEKTIENYVGTEVCQKVMVGSEKVTETSNREKRALWAKDAIDRLDGAVDEKTRIQIMHDCGSNCAEKNKSVIQKAVDRRKKFDTLGEFLKAEIQTPPKGTRLEMDGDRLIQVYTPQTFSYPMRCYCALIRYLPSEVTISKTYCRCSEGFIKKYWETITGKPVNITLLESAVSGSSECKFAVEF